jgi:RHS repeat-associated protein
MWPRLHALGTVSTLTVLLLVTGPVPSVSPAHALKPTQQVPERHRMTVSERRDQVLKEYPGLAAPVAPAARAGIVRQPDPTAEHAPGKALPGLKAPAVGSAPADASYWGVAPYWTVTAASDGAKVFDGLVAGAAFPSNTGAFPRDVLTAKVLVYNSDGDLEDAVHDIKITWTFMDCHGDHFYDFGQTVSTHSWYYAGSDYSAGALVTAQFTVPADCTWREPGVFGNGGIDLTATGTEAADQAAPFIVTTGPDRTLSHGCPCVPNDSSMYRPQNWRGDPVNTATGEYADSFADVVVPGKGYPFAVTRSYSSGVSRAGALGRGWSLPWEASLAVQPNGDVIFTAADGNRYTYAKNSDGTFGGQRGVHSGLTAISTGYRLTTVELKRLFFDSAGRLTSIVDRTGTGLTIAYSGSQVSTVTDAAGRSAALTYSSGLLTGIALADGRHVGYAYTGGLLTTVTDLTGKPTTYAYDSAARLVSIRDPNGHEVTRNVYDSSGRVTSQQSPTGATTTFSYLAGETDVTYPDGGVWTDLYSDTTLMASIDPYGNKTSYRYTPAWHVAAITDPLGRHTYQGFGTYGGLESRNDPLGETETWSHDQSDNVTDYTDRRGNRTLYTYNGSNQLASMTTANGGRTTFAYDAAGLLSTRVEPRGNLSGAVPGDYTWTFGHDANGDLTSAKDPMGHVTSATYDNAGGLLTVTDGNGKTTSYIRDAATRVTKVTAPDGGVTTFAYDDAGNLTRRTDANGHSTTYAYDAANRLAKVTAPLSRVKTFTYDEAHDTATFVNGRGDVQTTTTDARGLPLRIAYSDATPAQTYVYDAAGQRSGQTDATGNSAFGYDADGQILSVTGAAGPFSYTYDEDGNVLTRTYPDGDKTSFTYDPDGNMATETTAGGTVAYAYDPAERLLKTTLPAANGYVETHAYDRAGRLTSIGSAKAGTILSSWNLTLDGAGRPTKIDSTRAGLGGARVGYTYDAAGRLVSAQSDGVLPVTGPVTLGIPGKCLDDSAGGTADGTKIQIYSCNGGVNQLWTLGADGTVKIHGKCMMVTGSGTANNTKIILFTCNGSGGQKWQLGAGFSLVNPQSGKCLDDPSGSSVNATQVQIYTCNATNPQKWRLLGNGSAPTGAWPSGIAGKCLDDAGGATANGTKVDIYSCNGTVAQIWTLYNDGTIRNYGKCLSVDANATADGAKIVLWGCNGSAGQKWEAGPTGYLVNPGSGKCLDDPGGSTTNGTQLDIYTCNGTAAQTWTIPGPRLPAQIAYTYDLNGNRLTRTADGIATTYTYDSADQLTAAVTGSATTTLGYDGEGNRTSEGNTTYAYDARNLLTRSVTGTTTRTFTYDAGGRRYGSYTNGTLTGTARWDLVAPLERIAQETDGAGATIADHHYDPLELLQSSKTSAGSFYDHHDWLGSTTDVTGDSGTNQYRFDYDPYGATVSTGLAITPPSHPMAYAGAYGEPGTGLYNMRARYYSPSTGTFLTRDPLEASSGQVYTYAAAAPTYMTDPTGRLAMVDNLIAGTVGGLASGGGALLTGLINGNVQWGDVGVATASGFVFGFTFAECGWCAGSASAMATSGINQMRHNKGCQVNMLQVAADGLVGGSFGRVGDLPMKLDPAARMGTAELGSPYKVWDGSVQLIGGTQSIKCPCWPSRKFAGPAYRAEN